MDTFLAIVSKRDQREYADREIPEEVVRRILEAGSRAARATNSRGVSSLSRIQSCATA